MHCSKYSAVLCNHNYGCNVMFTGPDSIADYSSCTFLITWKQVLKGKSDRIMVWREGNIFRNLYANFSDRCKTNQGILAVLNKIFLNGKVYDGILSRCDKIFIEAIKLSYTDYVVIGSHIITRTVINTLVDSYILCMKSHFDTFYEILGFKLKSRQTKNSHLNKYGYYKRQVFYNMLAMSRQNNPQQMKHWAMASAAANYGRGIGEKVS